MLLPVHHFSASKIYFMPISVDNCPLQLDYLKISSIQFVIDFGHSTETECQSISLLKSVQINLLVTISLDLMTSYTKICPLNLPKRALKNHLIHASILIISTQVSMSLHWLYAIQECSPSSYWSTPRKPGAQTSCTTIPTPLSLRGSDFPYSSSS